MTIIEPTVFIVDDDPATRDSVRWLIESIGMQAETFASAQEFLDAYNAAAPGCLLLDLRLPGMSGLDLQEQLCAQQSSLPVIILTGYGDVPAAVRALRAGAFDFIEKPCNDQALLDCVRRALDEDARRRENQAMKADVAARYALLTPRERQVMGMVVEGKANKQIAASLGLSHKTVETHRAQVMRKMRAESIAELVRLAYVASTDQGEPWLKHGKVPIDCVPA